MSYIETQSVHSGHTGNTFSTKGFIQTALSILSLKLWHMRINSSRRDAPELAAECGAKLLILKEQREDLARCLRRLLDDCRAGRRFFKLYRQLKAYNDPRLNPALANQG